MKHCFTILLTFLFPLFATAYEGVLEYKISSADRDWKLVCTVKDDFFRAEVYLGSTHFQTILRNEEGLLLLDEMNKQIIQADYEREKWGKPGQLQHKVDNKGDYETKGTFNVKGLSGTVYSIRHKRKDYRLEVVEGLGAMPGIFLDQFTSLRGLHEEGRVLFNEHPGMPVRIYRNKKDSKPLMELVKKTDGAVDSSVFEVNNDYIRAKMRFKMR